MIETVTPGKLMVVGEWGVLEPGVPCVVAALNRYVTVRLEPADTISLAAPDLQLARQQARFEAGRLEWQGKLTPTEKEKVLIAHHVLEVTLTYLQAQGVTPRTCAITTAAPDTVVVLPEGTVAKVGFGSSAAVAVGLCQALLEFHGLKTAGHQGRELIFKLACLGHYGAQGRAGSSFDVAASAFGGLLVYRRFDPAWLADQYAAGRSVVHLAQAPWPGLHLEPLAVPPGFRLLVGYTGPDTITKAMIGRLNAFKQARPEAYRPLIGNLKSTVEAFIKAMRVGDPSQILELITQNRRHLQELAAASGLELETPALARLAAIAEAQGGAGKFSGSGGGGLGIAVCFDGVTEGRIKEAWRQAGIEPVAVKITSPNGR